MSDRAFVPTMGALHAGHFRLIERAREIADEVVVSIFVNPLQFENQSDLAAYPRNIEADTEAAIKAGATTIWAPTIDEIYPEGDVQKISAGAMGSIFEGAARSGHFDGVLTVVQRLFAHVQPRYAIFGEKDFQQLTIIKSWVRQGSIPVEIISEPTVRDSDGLALSSRNARLNEQGRRAALVIPRALTAAVAHRSLDAGLAELANEPAFTLDYFDYVDERNLSSIKDMNIGGRFLLAGWVNEVRLLDNMPMRQAVAE